MRARQRRDGRDDVAHVGELWKGLCRQERANLEVPHALGMRTVLVVPAPIVGDHREPWEGLGASEPYVDMVTADLAGFLRGLVLTDLSPTTP